MITTPVEGLSEVALDEQPNTEGVQHKHVYSTPSGKRWLGKVQNIDAELDHYIVMSAAGIRTPAIGMRQMDKSCEECDYMGDGDREILIEWIDDADVLANRFHVEFTNEQYADLLKVWMIDYLTGNYDRHAFNLLIDNSGDVVPIDGGFLFTTPIDYNNLGNWDTENPVANLYQDSLTDVFSFVDVMMLANEVIRSVRSVIDELEFKHQRYVDARSGKLTTIVATWYRAASKARVYHLVP